MVEHRTVCLVLQLALSFHLIGQAFASCAEDDDSSNLTCCNDTNDTNASDCNATELSDDDVVITTTTTTTSTTTVTSTTTSTTTGTDWWYNTTTTLPCQNYTITQCTPIINEICSWTASRTSSGSRRTSSNYESPRSPAPRRGAPRDKVQVEDELKEPKFGSPAAQTEGFGSPAAQTEGKESSRSAGNVLDLLQQYDHPRDVADALLRQTEMAFGGEEKRQVLGSKKRHEKVDSVLRLYKDLISTMESASSMDFSFTQRALAEVDKNVDVVDQENELKDFFFELKHRKPQRDKVDSVASVLGGAPSFSSVPGTARLLSEGARIALFAGENRLASYPVTSEMLQPLSARVDMSRVAAQTCGMGLNRQEAGDGAQTSAESTGHFGEDTYSSACDPNSQLYGGGGSAELILELIEQSRLNFAHLELSYKELWMLAGSPQIIDDLFRLRDLGDGHVERRFQLRNVEGLPAALGTNDNGIKGLEHDQQVVQLQGAQLPLVENSFDASRVLGGPEAVPTAGPDDGTAEAVVVEGVPMLVAPFVDNYFWELSDYFFGAGGSLIKWLHLQNQRFEPVAVGAEDEYAVGDTTVVGETIVDGLELLSASSSSAGGGGGLARRARALVEGDEGVAANGGGPSAAADGWSREELKFVLPVDVGLVAAPIGTQTKQEIPAYDFDFDEEGALRMLVAGGGSGLNGSNSSNTTSSANGTETSEASSGEENLDNNSTNMTSNLTSEEEADQQGEFNVTNTSNETIVVRMWYICANVTVGHLCQNITGCFPPTTSTTTTTDVPYFVVFPTPPPPTTTTTTTTVLTTSTTTTTTTTTTVLLVITTTTTVTVATTTLAPSTLPSTSTTSTTTFTTTTTTTTAQNEVRLLADYDATETFPDDVPPAEIFASPGYRDAKRRGLAKALGVPVELIVIVRISISHATVTTTTTNFAQRMSGLRALLGEGEHPRRLALHHHVRRRLAYEERVNTEFAVSLKPDSLAAAVATHPDSFIAKFLEAGNPGMAAQIQQARQHAAAVAAGSSASSGVDIAAVQAAVENAFVAKDFYDVAAQTNTKLQSVQEAIPRETNTVMNAIALDPTLFIEGPPLQSALTMNEAEVAVVGAALATAPPVVITTTTPLPTTLAPTTTTTLAPVIVQMKKVEKIFGLTHTQFFAAVGVLLFLVLGSLLYCYRRRQLRLQREYLEEMARLARESELRRLASMRVEDEASSVDTFVAVIEQERKEAEEKGIIPPPSLPYKFKMAKVKGLWEELGSRPKVSDDRSVYYDRIVLRDRLRAETVKRYGFATSGNMLKAKDVEQDVLTVATNRAERKNPRQWDIPWWAKRPGAVMSEWWPWKREYLRQVAPPVEDDASWSEEVSAEEVQKLAEALSSGLQPGTEEAFHVEKKWAHKSGAGRGETLLRGSGSPSREGRPKTLLDADETQGEHFAKVERTSTLLRAKETLDARRDTTKVVETVAGGSRIEDTVTAKGKRKKHKKIVHY